MVSINNPLCRSLADDIAPPQARLGRAAGMMVAAALAIGQLAYGTPVRPLDLNALTESADVIVVGRVSSITQVGKTDAEVRGILKPVRILRGEMSVDTVLKGKVEASDVAFSYLLPIEESFGYRGVPPNSYRILFLKGKPPYTFADPFYPSLVASAGEPAISGNVFDKVVAIVGSVLRDNHANVEQKYEAILVLRDVRTPAATQALRSALSEPVPELRLSAAAALLFRNDLTGLRVAEENLLATNPTVSSDLLHNLTYALGRGVKDDAAIPALTRLLQSPATKVRRAAVLALVHVGSQSAIDVLVLALADRDPQIRHYAMVGLADLTNQPEWRPSQEGEHGSELRYLSYWRDWARTRH